MTPLVTTLNFYLGIGTIVLLAASVLLLGFYLLERFGRAQSSFGALASRYALHAIALLSLFGLVMTLVYSEVFGFVPCGLCWLGRIALYPMALIAPMATVMKDRVFAPAYMLGLSVFGLIISLYTHYIQMGGTELIDCPAAGADCAKRIMFEFGFVTYPLMGFSLFAFIFVILLIQRRYTRLAA